MPGYQSPFVLVPSGTVDVPAFVLTDGSNLLWALGLVRHFKPKPIDAFDHSPSHSALMAFSGTLEFFFNDFKNYL